MKKNFNNATHVEGLLYEHSLELKTTGPNSKNPGTQYIAGDIKIATDAARTNIVPVHFTYVTSTTAKGNPNATYTLLNNIITGNIGTVMKDGVDRAGKLRVDSAIALNEWYSDRNGTEELISTKRNEGGFVHTTDSFSENEAARSTFDCDILITSVTHKDADPEKNLPDKAIIKGAIFNFRNALMPVEFSAIDPRAIAYFEGLDASPKDPVFTRIKGQQVSETITQQVSEASAFGDPVINERKTSHKDFVVTWASPEPYVWDSEDTLTAADVTKMIADRELMLATMKQQREEYKKAQSNASANSASAFAAPKTGDFKF